MKNKELSKEDRHKMVKKHHSEEGYEKILKSLIILLSTVKSIIKKWKTHRTTQTRPRSGRPSMLSSRASRKLVWDVTVNLTMTLKDLQGPMSEHNILFPSQSWPLLKKTSKRSYAVIEKAS